ncbi:MAG: hypothetical protein P4L16_02950 [Chlamydiales bacterium]|nr:hypothetical protein [Chlamydiales bacterium]
MFTVSSSISFTLYLGIFLLLLLALWLIDNKRHSKKTKLPPLSELFICEYCHFPYLDRIDKDVTMCPQCKSFNKNNRYKNKS